jgi:hypothetical protein
MSILSTSLLSHRCCTILRTKDFTRLCPCQGNSLPDWLASWQGSSQPVLRALQHQRLTPALSTSQLLVLLFGPSTHAVITNTFYFIIAHCAHVNSGACNHWPGPTHYPTSPMQTTASTHAPAAIIRQPATSSAASSCKLMLSCRQWRFRPSHVDACCCLR